MIAQTALHFGFCCKHSSNQSQTLEDKNILSLVGAVTTSTDGAAANNSLLCLTFSLCVYPLIGTVCMLDKKTLCCSLSATLRLCLHCRPYSSILIELTFRVFELLFLGVEMMPDLTFHVCK